jgi:hypothetical protein
MIEAVPMARAFELARTNPGFHAELLTQIGLAQSLSVSPQPTLAPLLAPAAAASANPWTPQAAALVGAYLARPAAAAAVQPQLTEALGPAAAGQLHEAAANFEAKRAANPGLDSELRQMAQGLDFTDHAAVQTFTAALFDNARLHPDASRPAVAVPDGPGRQPPVRLVKSTRAPLSSSELAEFVAKNKTVSPEGLVRLTFPSGQYHPEYEKELVALGVHRVNIAEPTRKEVSELAGDAHDFRVVSDKVRWVMTTRTMDEHEKDLADNSKGGKGSHAAQFRKSRETTKGLTTKPSGVLTVADWNKWYDVYENEVVGVDRHGVPIPGKRQGRRAVARDMGKGAALTDEFFKNDGWYGFFYYDEAGAVVGGDIYKAIADRGIFVNGYAAYRPELKPFNPSIRAFEEGNELAAKAGYKVFSFGMDTNEYGHDYSLGLMASKAGFLLQPFGEGTIMLSKMINTQKFAAHTDKEGRTGGYGYFGLSDVMLERYLADRDQGTQKTADQYFGRSFKTVDGVVRAANGFSAPEATVFNYYVGTAPALRTPRGVPVDKRPMAAPASVPSN